MLIGVDHRYALVTPVIMLVRIGEALAIIIKGTIEHVVDGAYSKPFKLELEASAQLVVVDGRLPFAPGLPGIFAPGNISLHSVIDDDGLAARLPNLQ
jgi:hypothetical protein